ncbi:MAG TPA: sulfatase-like hydrolase/transferase [Vicinamibacteria bacterium]|nr:sulfatase-like hydrolase/transferase [Vicinamibacteria bacterium]
MPAYRLVITAAVLSLLAGCGPRREPVQRIVLVTIDTIRPDRMGFMGSDVETPNLDRLARSGAIFTQAITSAPITLPAHASILSGLYPSSHGIRFNGIFRLSDDVETVAETLKDRGYATGAFVGAFVLDRLFGLEQGFDVYDDEFPNENTNAPMQFAERRAEEVVARALDFIEAHERDPLFVWVHVYDPHLPHNAPSAYAERYPGRAYDAEVAYTDASLGPLFDAMDDRAAIIVIGDHGEGLGDHGESTHTLFVYDSTMKVPFILKAPGVPAGARVESQVRSIDVAPTILELAGISPRGKLDGVSLLDRLGPGTAEDLSAYGETFGTLYQFNWSELRFLRRDGFKFIEAPRPELYDLGADPEEANNLWTENPPEVGRRLRRELDGIAKSESRASATPVDEETKRQLESLGYVASAPQRQPGGGLPDPKDRVEIFDRIQELLAPGVSAERQIQGLREILALEPGNILAQKRIAGVLAHEGRLEEAVLELEKLYRIAEFETKDWENLISALLLLNRTEQALALTGQALTEFPRYRELQVLRGEALEQSGRLEDARGAYTKAIELRPEGTEDYWRRGAVAHKLGDLEGAERDFRESVARDAQFQEARLALARLLTETGRPVEAIDLLGEATNARAKTTLAEAVLALGRYEEARAHLEEALQLDPDNTRALILLGPIYGRAGELALAARTLERAVSLGESSPEVRRNLALVYLQQAKVDAALAQLKQAADDAPREPSIWFSLGNTYLRARKATSAVEAFEKALALRSEWPEATFNLALAYQTAGQPSKAADAYRRFLSSQGSADPEKRAEAEERLAALEKR